MRSVLVVLSLLAFVAQPVEAGQKSKAARQKKAAALKKAGAGKQKKVKPTGESTAHQAPGSLGGTRRTHQDGSHTGLPRSETVIARTGSGSSARTVTRNRAQPRNAAISTHQRESTVVPTGMATASRSFDSSAAVAPRKKTGRVKRWFAGLFLVAALAGGGYGWHAADMNSKVGDAWTYVTHVISDATHQNGGGGGGGGGGHTTPIPPVPDNPQPPFPDPGPPTPDNPDNQTPGPSGGHGHQTPHHPETDHRGG